MTYDKLLEALTPARLGVVPSIDRAYCQIWLLADNLDVDTLVLYHYADLDSGYAI